MFYNVYEGYSTLAKNYYGLSIYEESDQEKVAQLNKEFSALLTADQAAYMTIITGTNKSTVLPALLTMSQGMIESNSLFQTYASDINAMLVNIAESSSQWNDQTRKQLSTNFASVAPFITPLLPTAPEARSACLILLSQIGQKMSSLAEQIRPLYSTFFAEKLRDVSTYVSEATVALSPTEIEQRRIAFEIFSLALSMLSALQRASTLAGTLMSYYTDVQREYMDLISQIQLYGPTGKYKIIVNSADFGKTQLGYSNTTVRNVLDYLISQIQTADAVHGQKVAAWYSMAKSGDTSMGAPITFKLVEKPTSTGEMGYAFSIEDRSPAMQDPPLEPTTVFSTEFCSIVNGNINYGAEGGAGTGVGSDLYADNLYLPNISLGGVDQERDLVDRLLDHITKQWNQTSDAYLTFTGTSLSTLKTLWTATGAGTTDPEKALLNYLYGPSALAWAKDDDEQKKKDAAASFRSETNAQIQIYLQNAQSLKQLAEDTGKRAESVLSQIQQSQENQMSLLSAIIDSLKGLLTAIFR